MTASHTPGPWQISTHRTSSRRVFTPTDTVEIVQGHNGMIACLYEHNWPHGQDQGNARLIAAAPTLLAALQKYRDQYGSPDTWPDDEAECLAAAEAAIALATRQD